MTKAWSFSPSYGSAMMPCKVHLRCPDPRRGQRQSQMARVRSLVLSAFRAEPNICGATDPLYECCAKSAGRIRREL